MLSGSFSVRGRIARWTFTGRAGGASLPPYLSLNLAAHVGDELAAVRANRVTLEKAFDAGPLSWMGPVHGTELAILDAPVALTPNVDALASAEDRTPLVTLGADCVPMLIAAGDLVIAAHVGWQGFADGITDTIVATLELHGIAVPDAQIVLGPAVCGACYGIHEERAERISARSSAAIIPARTGSFGADIRRGLESEWSALGASVTRVGPCTYEDPTYFSHRRDGTTGRQGGVIAWIS